MIKNVCKLQIEEKQVPEGNMNHIRRLLSLIKEEIERVGYETVRVGAVNSKAVAPLPWDTISVAESLGYVETEIRKSHAGNLVAFIKIIV